METSDTERVVTTKSSVTILLPLLPGYLTRFKAIQIRKSVRKTYISLPIPYTGGAGGVGSNPAAPNNFFLHRDISSRCLACVFNGIFFNVSDYFVTNAHCLGTK